MKTAYPTLNQPVHIRLYSNVPFDNTYKHHSMVSPLFTYNGVKLAKGYSPLFTDREKFMREIFLNRKDYTKTGSPNYYPQYDMSGEFNFDFTNGLVGSVILELTPAQTNANYMRVQIGSSDATFEHYYYFITSITQLNGDTYRVAIECDVLMTYQDEFLSGLQGVPIFTKRKHCFRYEETGYRPYCADLRTGESVFANIKPTYIYTKIDLNYAHAQMKKLKDIMWLYVCIDAKSNNLVKPYKINNYKYPFFTLCIPIGINSLKYCKLDGTSACYYDNDMLEKGILKLINNGSCHGAKVSPYPPFSITSNAEIALDNSRNLEIKTDNMTLIASSNDFRLYRMTINGCDIVCYQQDNGTSDSLIAYGFAYVETQYYPSYEYESISGNNFGWRNALPPMITLDRYEDPKLLFNPFRKYTLNAMYSSSGWEFYPELIFSKYTIDSGHDKLVFTSFATGYIGDNNLFTKMTFGNTGDDSYIYTNYSKYDKIGLSSTLNYTIPVGTNALDVFNSTQAQSFYQSKTASGITAGLTMAGGVGMTALGVAGLASGWGTPMGVGMIAGGVSSIASGVASISNNIKSAQAKIEDLKNTPDSINISGSNFIFDDNLIHYRHPYVVVYDVDALTKQNANDFFYAFGYNVSRQCYFNTELKFENDTNDVVDNNLFGRDIFNYIEINEDITNKINADIPHIIKQKISSIFNNGITLWSFFGFDELWKLHFNVPASTYYLDNWFMKNELDNSEVNFAISQLS